MNGFKCPGCITRLATDDLPMKPALIMLAQKLGVSREMDWCIKFWVFLEFFEGTANLGLVDTKFI